MKEYCKHCALDVISKEGVCPFCGNQLDESTNYKNGHLSNPIEKRLAILSIVFGILGIYPLIGVGGVVGLILAKKGLKSNPLVYKKQLVFGFWISFIGFAFWGVALIVTLVILLAPIFKFIWEQVIFYLRLFFGLS
jgi:hypothetical protein